ncbi:MAG: transposase [Mycobacterium sp.]|nr:transposase [Mycobacterium sp.]
MRTVCDQLDVELVEFNGETDHVHLLVAYRPPSRFPLSHNASKAAPPTRCHANSPVRVCAPACAATYGSRPTSPSPAAAHRCPSSSNTSTDKPDHSDRRAAPGDTRDGLTPAINGEACATVTARPPFTG